MPKLVQQVIAVRKAIEEGGGKKLRIRRPGRPNFPRSISRDYAKALVEIIKVVRDDIEQSLVPELGRIVSQNPIVVDSARADDDGVGDLISKTISGIHVRLDNKHLRDLEQVIRESYNKTSLYNLRQVRKQIKRMLGVDAFPTDPGGSAMLNSFLRDNAALIKSLSGDYIRSVSGIVHRGVRSGERPESMSEKIRDRYDVTANKAMLIARDQTNKLNGDLTHMRQKSLGIDKYYWRTSLDERVRASHLEKEGKLYSWDEPPEDTGHPGESINCRCTAEPYIEGITEKETSANRREKIREVKSRRKLLSEGLKRKKPPRPVEAEPKPVKTAPVEKDTYSGVVKKGMNVKQAENAIHKLDHEEGVVFDNMGNQLVKKVGTKHNVTYSAEEIRKIVSAEDAVLTHNHPSGSPLSDTDFVFCVNTNIKEIRATTPSGHVWSAKRTKPNWGYAPQDLLGGRYKKEIKAAHKRAYKKARKEISELFSKPSGDYARITKGAKPEDVRREIIDRRFLYEFERLGKNCGFEVKKIRPE